MARRTNMPWGNPAGRSPGGGGGGVVFFHPKCGRVCKTWSTEDESEVRPVISLLRSGWPVTVHSSSFSSSSKELLEWKGGYPLPQHSGPNGTPKALPYPNAYPNRIPNRQ